MAPEQIMVLFMMPSTQSSQLLMPVEGAERDGFGHCLLRKGSRHLFSAGQCELDVTCICRLRCGAAYVFREVDANVGTFEDEATKPAFIPSGFKLLTHKSGVLRSKLDNTVLHLQAEATFGHAPWTRAQSRCRPHKCHHLLGINGQQRRQARWAAKVHAS